MFITLTDEYVLGIDSIDRQHARLVEIINRLSVSLSQGKRDVENILHELARYAEEHFSYEETYFAKCDYPETVAHERGHRTFLTDIEKFREQSQRKDNSLIAVELLGFLEDWLSHHILIADKKFVNTLLRCGVE